MGFSVGMNISRSEAKDNNLHKHETPGISTGSFHLEGIYCLWIERLPNVWTRKKLG